MSAIPAKYRDILEKKTLASLATILPDGTPQVTPVWFHFDGSHIEINSARGRVKDRNMRSRPQVALAVVDPDNLYRYLEIRGEVVEITEKGADQHIDFLARKYLDVEKYPFRGPDEVRVKYRIKPLKCTSMG
ncbi:MAG: PPOX class F420-dependent oxidoreductase [Armatimonadetes bacterium]|nr:PPOX class F420-dependent oxidoreductase [Armatimonadota bacterium]